MSYTRASPSAPSDLVDDSPYYNREFVKPHPYKQGVYLTIKPCRQCSLCGWEFDPKLRKCPGSPDSECGCPSSRFFPPDNLIHVVARNAVAHFKRKLIVCWNQKEDPMSGEIVKHDFVSAEIPVILTVTTMTPANNAVTDYEWHLEIRCRVCNAVYQRIQGRQATSAEIQQFKDGKIERATKLMLPHPPGDNP